MDYFIIPLTCGKGVLVDKGDLDVVSGYTWRATKNGKKWYAVTGSKKKIYMHRLLAAPDAPSNVLVDHEDGNGLNNRRLNLRVATMGLNLANRGAQSNSASGVKGVSWDKARNKWRVQVGKGAKRFGRFSTLDEAMAAYAQWASELYGEFSNVGCRPPGASNPHTICVYLPPKGF